DPGMEEALYEVPLLRQFVGIDLGRDFVPDETTILKSRRLLERHALAPAIFAEVQAVLQEKGLLLQEGKTVDATWIHAPSSTKNRDRKRDPEMSSTKKGNQLDRLLTGKESVVLADRGYDYPQAHDTLAA
ncbi:transposase, partial [Acidithiobacillus caldus]